MKVSACHSIQTLHFLVSFQACSSEDSLSFTCLLDGEWIDLKYSDDDDDVEEEKTLATVEAHLSALLNIPVDLLTVRLGQMCFTSLDLRRKDYDLEPLIAAEYLYLKTRPYNQNSTIDKEIEFRIEIMHTRQYPMVIRCSNQITVKELKQIIRDKKGYDVSEQTLEDMSYTMYDSMKLSNYQITDYSSIRLIRRYLSVRNETESGKSEINDASHK
ncbi:unnamed protein product [Didymodactylos carnosus]|uniref:Ubiquitin-like domain-containing protein n=1 Tax=Didymodactylos carnosus TaxID=1234261 RepID=A0A815TFR8_9BILA|nr:unnamed protein product [Didymodactylos carnosus]CAF4364688.1 unnamed protein product [Didymodactylos carnosus]